MSPARDLEESEQDNQHSSELLTAEEKLQKKKETISLVVSQLMEDAEGNVSARGGLLMAETNRFL